MNRKQYLLFISCAILIIIGGTACKKKGCTDSRAINFDKAATDDCCCQYPRIVYYYSTADYFDSTSHKSYHVDSVKVKSGSDSSMLHQVYPNGPADCDAPGTFSPPSGSGDAALWKIRVYFKGGAYLDDAANEFFAASQACHKINVF